MDRRPLALALLASILMSIGVFASVPVRSDLTDLLPRGSSKAARLMMHQLRAGSAGSLILAGIEGPSESTLAKVSQRMRDLLGHDRTFVFVENGQNLLDRSAIKELFAQRYLLSPAVNSAAFEVPALRRDFARLLQGLQSSAAPLVEQFGLPDPTGAFPALLTAWTQNSRVRTAHGVWFAAPTPGAAPRALLLIRARATSVDFAAQQKALAAVRRAFAAAAEGTQAKLLLGGPIVLANDAAVTIRHDAQRISVLSVVLVSALLFWRFRSLWALAAIAVPMLSGVAIAALVTALRFGFVHSITLGFGMTMLGITADYPVLLIGHRKQDEPATGTLARIGRTFAVAAVTTAIGLSAMVFAAAPAVSQLGVFAVTGILTAAAVTYWLLPRLLVAAALAPVAPDDLSLLRRLEGWRRFRLAGYLVVAAAALILALTGGPRWQGNLGALTPVSPAKRAADAALSRQLGAPESGTFILVPGATQEAVLQREESLEPLLRRLVADRIIGGVATAAQLLPSMATQRARQHILPDASTLSQRVRRARTGTPFSAGAFQRFEKDVARARQMRPVRPADIHAPLLAAPLDALLVPGNGGWLGLIVPREVSNPSRLAAALADQPGLLLIDVKHQINAMANQFARRVWPLLAGGGAISFLCMLLALRDPRRVGRVLLSIAASLLVTVTILSLCRVRLTLIHVVALQFVAGVGLDYALFFARTQVEDKERARTLRTITICASMALLTFGLLSLCRTPLLAAIGETVAIGVIANFLFSFLFVGPRVVQRCG